MYLDIEPSVSPACIRIPDLRWERFKEAIGGVLGDGGDKGDGSCDKGTTS
jgi:hypothetical protein